MLEIKNLQVNCEEDIILKDFNLAINDGEIHTIMGPNGVGKSTICKTILKHPNYKVMSGNIILNGEDITNLDTATISKKGVMLIMQNPTAVEGVTNAEMLRTLVSEKSNEHINIFKFNKELQEIADKIELPRSFIHRDINVGMSGGERKKNELLHLWMLKPNLLLLDEIDSGLDVDALKLVGNSIKEYHDTYNASIILITHNPHLLNVIKPDYVHVLKNKKIIKTGNSEIIDEIENSGFQNINEANIVSDYE